MAGSAESARTTTVATGAMDAPVAEKIFRSGLDPGCPRRGGAGVRTTRSSIQASSRSSRRSKSSICSGNASLKGSTHPRRLCSQERRAPRNRRRRVCETDAPAGLGGLTAFLRIVQLMRKLDHLQAERSRTEETFGEDGPWLDDGPGVDDFARQLQHPRHILRTRPPA